MIRSSVLAVTALTIVGGCSTAGDKGTTYALACSKPLPGWLAADHARGSLYNTVSIKADGALTWNGEAMVQATMREYLQQAAELSPQPPIVLEADSKASCAVVESARKDIDKALGCAAAWSCGEGAGDPQAVAKAKAP